MGSTDSLQRPGKGVFEGTRGSVYPGIVVFDLVLTLHLGYPTRGVPGPLSILRPAHVPACTNVSIMFFSTGDVNVGGCFRGCRPAKTDSANSSLRSEKRKKNQKFLLCFVVFEELGAAQRHKTTPTKQNMFWFFDPVCLFGSKGNKNKNKATFDSREEHEAKITCSCPVICGDKRKLHRKSIRVGPVTPILMFPSYLESKLDAIDEKRFENADREPENRPTRIKKILFFVVCFPEHQTENHAFLVENQNSRRAQTHKKVFFVKKQNRKKAKEN